MDVFNHQSSKIDFYTESQSRNGATIAILLEELGLPYNLHKVDTAKNAHQEPWFLAVNPNGRLPALRDVHPNGSKVRLFETGSTMQYLIDTYDTDHRLSYPKGSPEAIEVNNWLFFHHAGVRPNHGEWEHFSQHAPEKIPYSIDRFKNETLRLYLVVEKHLDEAKTDYLVGHKCTIADIALYPWAEDAESAGIDIEQFPTLTAWYNRMNERTAVQKGMSV